MLLLEIERGNPPELVRSLAEPQPEACPGVQNTLEDSRLQPNTFFF